MLILILSIAFFQSNQLQLSLTPLSKTVVEYLPADIYEAVYGDGKIFMSVIMKSKIFVIDTKGNSLPPLGNKGMGPNEIMHPHAMAFKDGKLYILDRGKGLLVVMNADNGNVFDSYRIASGNALLVNQHSIFVAFNQAIETGNGNQMIGRAAMETPTQFDQYFYQEPCCLRMQGTKASGLLVDKKQALWIAYTGEYRLEKFQEGKLAKRMVLEPTDFVMPKSITQKQRYDRKARSLNYRSFDKVGGIFQLGDAILLHRYKSIDNARMDVYSLEGRAKQFGLDISNVMPFSAGSDRLLGYREAMNDEDLLLEIVEIELVDKTIGAAEND